MKTGMKEQKNVGKGNLLRCILLVAIACLVYGVMQGVHDNYGIMMTGLIPTTGLTYQSISFCIGVGALIYGFAQPLLGMLALRKSYAFVIIVGIISMVTGLVVSPLCRNLPSLLLFFGILLPFGTTGLSFGIMMGAITPIIGDRRAAMVSGIVQASAGVGDAIMSPMLSTGVSSIGVQSTMSLLTIPFLIMIPIAIWVGVISKKEAKPVSDEVKKQSLFSLLKEGLAVRDYRLIVAGFSTCGFNMSIIESHLYSQFIDAGISRNVASLALSVYGIATMLGAVLTGFLGVKFRMKNVLGSVYATRVIISLGFLFLPKTAVFAIVATALLGMSGDSTVPPTTGIISRLFGSEKMAVLYGFALIGHQLGAFLSAYLGGVFVSNGLGYAPLWVMNLILAGFAAIESYRIRTK